MLVFINLLIDMYNGLPRRQLQELSALSRFMTRCLDDTKRDHLDRFLDCSQSLFRKWDWYLAIMSRLAKYGNAFKWMWISQTSWLQSKIRLLKLYLASLCWYQILTCNKMVATQLIKIVGCQKTLPPVKRWKPFDALPVAATHNRGLTRLPEISAHLTTNIQLPNSIFFLY